MAFDSRNSDFSPGSLDLLEQRPPTQVDLRPRPRLRSLDRASNSELVEQAAAGDRRAWEALVERYAGLVEAVAVKHRLDRHDVNDVSQLTWLRLTQNLNRLSDPERVGLWLHTTARRECLAVLKRSGRVAPAAIEDQLVDDGEQPEELVARAEQAQHVRSALSRLPERCRTLLEMMLIQDPPAAYSEISERCAIAVGTIGPRRHRCLAHLRRLYDEAFPDHLPEHEG